MLEKYITQQKFDKYEDFVKNFKINVPENFNFGYDIVDEWARIEPNKKALVWCDDKGCEKTFTFADIKKHTDKTANFFKSIGIKKGDAVLLVLKRRYEFWFSIVALHKLGAVAIPATHLLTKKDIVYRANAANVKMIVCVNAHGLPEIVNQAQQEAHTLKNKVVVNADLDGWYNFEKEVEKQSEIFERPQGDQATKNADEMLLYFTSGTSGMPKMVVHDFVYPLGLLIVAQWQNLQENGLHLTVADTGWAKAAWGKIYGQWITGTTVFVYDFDKFTPKDILETIAKHKVTSFCAPPTIYRYLIKEDIKSYDLSNLKYCAIAGEPLDAELFNNWKKLTGVRVMEAYGQTELVSIIANFPMMTPKPGSIGKPAPYYDIDIVDDDYKSCEIGEVGQIVVRMKNGQKPAGVFSGYYKDPELTKQVWHDGLYFTGDTAYKDEDGYFWFIGRADDVIKSSGYRIGPFEVESALLEHPAVLECAITAVPDPDRGQIVKATIVLSKGFTPSEDLKKELQNHVKKVTAPYKYPRVVDFVEELPKTISGKIRRVQIRQTDNNVK